MFGTVRQVLYDYNHATIKWMDVIPIPSNMKVFCLIWARLRDYQFHF